MGQQVQLFAVMGQPIAHSLSPVMHNQAFRQRDWPAFYFPVEAGPDQLPQKLAAFQSLGGVGANLTRPLKEVVVPLLREASPWVRRTGACNTILWRDGGWVGDNTDVQALLEALPPARPGDRALVLGAGGAAQASGVALAERGYHVTAAMRHPRSLPWATSIIDWDERLKDAEWAVVINATPLGQAGEEALGHWPRPIPGGIGVDWVYRPRWTPFLESVRQSGGRPIDGLTLLVEQARLAWRLWFQETAPAAPMWDAVAPWLDEGMKSEKPKE